MEADILRLILIVVGGGVILGIYLWDRYKRVGKRVKTIRQGRGAPRREPTLRGTADPEPMIAVDVADDLDDDLATPDPMVVEPRPEPKAEKSARRKAPRIAEAAQPDLFPTDDATAPEAPGQEAGLPKLILQINIAARGSWFQGADILRAMADVEMHSGDMNIFHRRDGKGTKGPVLFSMASMVEPGTFPLKSMQDFSTPGLTLFAQLPGPQDGLALFSDMLFTAERIAAVLDGELQDETHSRLTKQTIEHLRSQVLEHRRQLQLAKSRHK